MVCRLIIVRLGYLLLWFLSTNVCAMTMPPVWSDAVKPIWYWLRLASYGDPEAAYKVGTYYERGQYAGPIKIKKAMRWYKVAASQGVSQAAVALGYLYWHGDGVHQDRGRAKCWFFQAAKAGDINGQRSWVHAMQVATEHWNYHHPQFKQMSPIALTVASAHACEAKALFQLGLLCEYDQALNCRHRAMYWYRQAAYYGRQVLVDSKLRQLPFDNKKQKMPIYRGVDESC